jgi:hypothetical protein
MLPKASDLVDFPTTNGALMELTYRLEAAFAIDPIPWSESLLRAAPSATDMRKQRIFFIDTPSLLAFQASDVRFTYPCRRRSCAQNRMGPSRIDHESKYMGKTEANEHYLRSIYGVFEVH